MMPPKIFKLPVNTLRTGRKEDAVMTERVYKEWYVTACKMAGWELGKMPDNVMQKLYRIEWMLNNAGVDADLSAETIATVLVTCGVKPRGA